jgi:cell division protein FtsW
MAKGRKQPDKNLLIVSIILVVFGVLILSSVSASISQEEFGSTFYFLKHQLIFGLALGVILGFLAFRIDLDLLKKWTPFLFFLNLILLLLVFFPKIGSGFRGTARWLNLGPVTLQPAEPLKITLILYWASWWSSKKSRRFKNPNSTLIAFGVIMSIISLLLVKQPDIGTLGIIIFLGTLLYFLAKTPFWHTLLIFFIGVLVLIVLIKVAPYRINRFLVFFDPDKDPMGIGYQLKQSLIAVGSGGISGVGFGLSRQKFGFLPESISDSIFAVFAEEFGFLGSVFLVFLFLIFFWRGYKISQACQDQFCQLLAIGISSWIILQAFINIGAMIGIVPLTGIPLPFISYGGSALISELVGVGLLLNISTKI